MDLSLPNKKSLHYIRHYLPLTTQWIYSQIIYNKAYSPVVISERYLNRSKFPLDPIYCFEDDLSFGKRVLNRICDYLVGYKPYFLTIARHESPSLIHAHFGQIGYKALGLKKKLNIPLVTTFYGHDISVLPRIAKYRARYQILFREGDLFLVEGTAMKRELINIGCSENKVRVFHLGVDACRCPFAVRKKVPNTPVRILFAATFTEKKGAEYAIKAFANAHKKHPLISMRIIGEGELKEQICQLVKQLNIESVVTISGYVSYHELIQEMLKAHIFIQPSVTARNGNTEGGAPVTLYDAQATGLPILSTVHADIPEVVLHQKTGLLCEERNSDELTKNLLWMLEHPQMWEKMGKAGRTHIEANYDIVKQGIELGTIYDSLTNKSNNQHLPIFD